jgi:hypothetical protein
LGIRLGEDRIRRAPFPYRCDVRTAGAKDRPRQKLAQEAEREAGHAPAKTTSFVSLRCHGSASAQPVSCFLSLMTSISQHLPRPAPPSISPSATGVQCRVQTVCSHLLMTPYQCTVRRNKYIWVLIDFKIYTISFSVGMQASTPSISWKLLLLIFRYHIDCWFYSIFNINSKINI